MSAKIRMTLSPSTLLASFITCVAVLTACSSKTAPPAAAEAPAQTAQPVTQAAPPSVPAPAVTQASWSPDALEQLVAPIALYPDQLVGQILAASVNSQEVLDAGNWLLQNQELKGDALDAAAQKAGLGPAMRALVQFPTIVDMMCQQIDWTRQLGSAFTSDQASVLDAVQRLRAQAQQVGNLKSTPQQTVETKTEEKKTVIEIKPADPQIVYVPQYNPQVIYTTPPPPAPAPAPASTSGTVSTEAAVVGGLLAFGLGIAIGNSMNNDSYCYPHWGAGAVYVGPRPFYPPAYVYRPVYSPGYRPAYGYAPPPGYRNSYNNVRVNGDVNVNVNNGNYFNQFKNNNDLRRGPNSPSTLPANTGNWKGQTTYAGSRNPPAQNPRGNAGLSKGSTYPSTGNLPSNRPAASATPGYRGAPARPNNAAAGGSRPTSGGTAANNRLPNQGGNNNRMSPNTPQQRPTNPAATRTPPTDRGYAFNTAGAGRPGASGAPARAAPAAAGPAGGERAFSGAGNGDGGFQRAASARGHASSGAMSSNRGGGGGNRAPRKR